MNSVRSVLVSVILFAGAGPPSAAATFLAASGISEERTSQGAAAAETEGETLDALAAKMATPARPRLASPVAETPDAIYRVFLHIGSGAEFHVAREFGLDLVAPGTHLVEVDLATLVELRRHGFRFSVVGGTSRFKLAPELVQGAARFPLVNASDPVSPRGSDDTGQISLSSGAADMTIDDNTGFAQGYRLRDASAPAGAQVTNLRYRTRIADGGDGDFWCGDYEIWLFSGDFAFEQRVYDNLGGATDGGYDDDAADDADIYLNWRSTSFFDGEDPNQWWGILIHDNLSGDDGLMNYVEFEIDWETPSTGDGYEPDDEWYEAWVHPHNYTSAFRSIDPLGDRDWITFTLSATSDVVVETLGASGDTELWLYDGSVTQIAYDDDSGSGLFSRISRSALPAGTYYARVEEFGDNQVISEYGISLSVQAAGLADLRASSYTSFSDTVQEGDAFWVEATIDNDGTGTAGPSHVRFYLSIDNDFDTSDDQEILPERSVIGLGAGGSTEVRWDFTFPDVLDATSYLVWLVFEVDSRNEVEESDENNTFKAIDTAYLTVWEPVDLQALDVYFRTQPGGGGAVVADPAVGTQVYPHLEYDVDAENALAGPTWKIELSTTLLCEDTSSTAAGDYVGWCTSPWTVSAGLHSLHGAVDPDDVTRETNESNNDIFRNYSIGTPDIRVSPLALHFSQPGTSGDQAATAPNALVRSDRPVLRLKHGSVDAGAHATVVGSALGRRHLLLQFRQLLDPAERMALEQKGVRILRYVPELAYWASVPPGSGNLVDVLTEGGGLLAAWHPAAELKTSRSALQGEFPPDVRWTDGTVLVHIRVFEDVPRADALAAFEQLRGATVVQEVYPGTYAVRLPEETVPAAAGTEIVEWVEPAPGPVEPHNMVAAQRIRVDHLHDPPYGLDGVGVNVGVWDEGSVDSHPDFGSRRTLHDAAATSYHSTHVAGTIGGSGAGDADATGMAPAAEIHSWDWSSDELEMRNEAPGVGLALSNHSYGHITGWWHDGSSWIDTGATGFGDYGLPASEWDDVVFDTGLLVFKSAGNDRNDGPDWPTGPRMDGPFDCIATNGNAKNIVTVCATQDDDSMTIFSSWGPSDDGRVKPDLCANGLGLWSTAPGGSYGSSSGTSMSSPSAAGAASLLFELFRSLNFSDPDPHLVKALMIDGARDLGRTGPDYEFGWGLINAEASADRIREGDWDLGLVSSTGEEAAWSLNLPAGAMQLKATIAWTDPAGSPAAAQALVNDLDLLLVEPGGGLVRPWTLDGAAPNLSATRGVNTVDNVEQVVVDGPVAGDWTIRVLGGAVAMGPQVFAVVAEGLGSTASPPGSQSFTIYNDGTTTLDVTGIALNQPGSWIDWSPKAPFSVVPGGNRRIDVSVDFSSAPEGSSTRRLIVSSNDPDENPYPGGVDLEVETPSDCNLHLSAQVVDDVQVFTACEVLSAGDAFAIVLPGDVTFRSGRVIVLRDGFSVGLGAEFKAVIDPSLSVD